MSRRNEIISSLAFLCISIVIFIQSFYINKLSGGNIGPDFLPKIVSIIMGCISILMLIKSLRVPKTETSKVSKKNTSKTSWLQGLYNDRKDIITIILIVMYIFAMDIIGFIASTILYLFVQLTLFREGKKEVYIQNICISVVTTLLIYYVFVELLYLMLP